MYAVRKATLNDGETLGLLAYAVHHEAPLCRDHAIDMQKLLNLLAVSQRADASITFLVCEFEGLVIGLLVAEHFPFFYNNSTFAANHLLYVSPEHRGSGAFLLLVDAFKKWAKQQNCLEIIFNTVTGIKPERTIRALERLGFASVGGTCKLKL